MYLAIAAVCVLALLFFLFRLRPSDLPEPTPPSPTHHQEVRKETIYENLRDLQFEYRLGKLSDDDYKRTKLELQGQLTTVLAEIDQIRSKVQVPGKAAAAAAGKTSSMVKAAGTANPNTCPHCGAAFDKPLKFCGECGKPMSKAQA